TILDAQGEAQKLRIMSIGAAAMDSKALSVLSMDTLKSVGAGQSSKIFFPMELTRLVNGISDYVGSAQKVPDREVAKPEDIKQAVGDPDVMLGPIPTPEDIRQETDEFKKTVQAEISESNEIAEKSKAPKV
ncbi:MAG: SPFH/Band 7/PHB domain protein, partial [Candidatus Methanomethylophilus sp.]|nr:SPFH/Band 7/PHB domain protein [Methanomethylophilus sp.]